MRDAVVLRILREKAAAKNRAHRHEWQPRILTNQKSQAVRQFKFLNLTGRDRFWTFSFSGKRPLWIQRDNRQIVFSQVLRSDAFDILERHFLDGVQIIAAK